ncbi:MAG: biotin--[acetyl-CoA-carboxylase] ligase [Pseudomonadota bacterium]
MEAKRILQILADGEVRATADIADQLGMSNVQVLRYLDELEHYGLSVERSPGGDLHIPSGVELLDPEQVIEGLTEDSRALLGELRVLWSTPSTNADIVKLPPIKERARVIVAEHQSAGKGRRGKAWVSPIACNIYLSVGWQFERGVEVLEGLSLAVGVVICDTLAQFGVSDLSLKWPNDVLRDKRKLAGVLIEVTGDPAGQCVAVIGLGVNVWVPESAQARIEQAWADLRTEQGVSPSRNTLIAAFLSRLLPALSRYPNEGFKHWRERWIRLDANAGAKVCVSSQTDQARYGIARGVDEHGALVLETENGIEKVHGGEVSLRSAD